MPIELDVNEQNPQAIGFYLKQGFEVIGRCEKTAGPALSAAAPAI
jgi:ribosomal protein S18 acetylase RimI-like enzyme